MSVFVLRGGLRRLVTRILTHPITQWPFSHGKPDRLLIAPQDLRTADATRASEIYAGRFAFAGKVVICDSRSPFEATPPSEDWAVALHGFGWLRHLRAADSAITRANARALVDEWITLNSAHDSVAWRPEVIARRVMSWLSQAPLVLDESDDRFYRPLPAQPDPAGAAPAPFGRQYARRRAAAAGRDRAADGVALHGRPAASHPRRLAALRRGAAAPDPARRRTHQP